jgi:hypothetical protein
VTHTLELIHAIEQGRRTCRRANLDLLAAYERLDRVGEPLNAVTAVGRPTAQSRASVRRLRRHRTTSTDGIVTTNSSTVGVPGPAVRRRAGEQAEAAGAELFCKTNLPSTRPAASTRLSG